MNVKQLKEALEAFPEDMEVCIIEEADHLFGSPTQRSVGEVREDTKISYNKDDPYIELNKKGNPKAYCTRRGMSNSYYSKRIVLIS